MTHLELDGYKVDAETGEILGLAEPFQVTDVKSAEWVMEKMFDAESKARAYELQAQGILDNLAKLTKFHRSKAEWLKTCYGSQLEEVAKANLIKGKKTWSSLFGSVAFRTTERRLAVIDPLKAFVWCQKNCPEATRVKNEVLVSQLSESAKIPLKAMNEDLVETIGFQWVPEGESMTIKVGA